MKTYLYIYMIAMTFLGAMGLGMNISKLGEQKTGKYSFSDFFFSLMGVALSGIAIYFLTQI